MKILLFGKNGQVGWELNRSLQPLGEVIALGREEADFSEPESLRVVVHNIKPDFIVNAVAYTAVDKAEDEEELAALINSKAPGVLAEEAFKIGALLVHFSTDYVFDGTKKGSYVEDDRPNPVNAYGRTKFEGEQTVQSSGCDYLIFRTSWVYAPRGHNFLLTVLKLAKERDVLNIVEDQMGSPTAARLIADTTGLCLHRAIKEKQSGVFSSGLYHLASSNYTSWYGFCVTAVKIAKEKLDLKLKIGDINAIPALSYPTKAARPANSQLCSAKLEKRFNVKIPDWSEGLRLCVDEIR
jgi:dTDP-4-dehydrorhamnose reductase